ncbi:MAG: hypothetical protein QXL15_02235 [Candidatus Korarchaeota archaeon]
MSATKVFFIEESTFPLVLDIADHGVPSIGYYTFMVNREKKEQIEKLVEGIFSSFRELGRNLQIEYVTLNNLSPYESMDIILSTFMRIYKNNGKFELHIGCNVNTAIFAYTIALFIPTIIEKLYLYGSEKQVIQFPLVQLVNPILMRKLATSIISILHTDMETTEENLATETKKDRSTISRIIKMLIESELVKITPGRPRKVALSPYGLIIAKILEEARTVEEQEEQEGNDSK